MKAFRKNIMMIASILIVVVVLVVFSQIDFSDNSFSDIYMVSDDHDDGRTFTVEGSEKGYDNEDGDWAFLQLSPSYSFGVRFTNVSIPRGSKIKEAYLELYSIGTPGHQHPNCRIYCDNVDDAVNFSVLGVLNISGRIYTSNYELWNNTVPYDVWVKTPGFVASVQEVIDRINWTSGNSIAVLFVSEGLYGYSAAFQNFENGYPARLYVEWE